MERLLEMVDGVTSGGNSTVQMTRKQLVSELQAYLAHLDQLRNEAWTRRKQLLGLAEGMPVLPPSQTDSTFIHNMCRFHPISRA